MRGKYKLDDDGKTPIVVENTIEWAEWYEGADEQRRVAKTHIDTDEYVSTVFLGLDHNFTGEGPPILFETMVFGGEFDEEQVRYATWDEAAEGHEQMVARLMRGREGEES